MNLIFTMATGMKKTHNVYRSPSDQQARVLIQYTYNGSHNRCEKTSMYAKNSGLDQVTHRKIISAPLLFNYLKLFYLYLLRVPAKFYILASLVS